MSPVFTPNKLNIISAIREVRLGIEDENLLKIGAQKAIPFVNVDGEVPNKLAIGIEVFDVLPDKYPEFLKEAWGESINDPVCWATMAKDYGANLIALRLEGIRYGNNSINDIVHIADDIINETSLPLAILGINNRELDKMYLPQIAEKLSGRNCLIGPVEEETYKDIIPSLKDNDHCVIARTPIDINLAKQLNILITEMGFNPDKILMDPNMGALGYGLDYAYSVVEKIRLAAFEGDNMLNMPILVFSGEEAWRTKETKPGVNDEAWGNASVRAQMWENLTTSSMLMAGADIVLMKHPASFKSILSFLERAQ